VQTTPTPRWEELRHKCRPPHGDAAALHTSLLHPGREPGPPGDSTRLAWACHMVDAVLNITCLRHWPLPYLSPFTASRCHRRTIAFFEIAGRATPRPRPQAAYHTFESPGPGLLPSRDDVRRPPAPRQRAHGPSPTYHGIIYQASTFPISGDDIRLEITATICCDGMQGESAQTALDEWPIPIATPGPLARDVAAPCARSRCPNSHHSFRRMADPRSTPNALRSVSLPLDRGDRSGCTCSNAEKGASSPRFTACRSHGRL